MPIEDSTVPASERMVERIARMDERQVQVAQGMRDLRIQMTEDAVQLKMAIDKVMATLDTKYVTKTEFTPVRLLVYGCTGTMLLAIITALVSLVIRTAPAAS